MASKMARREFLAGLGRAVGGSVMLRSMLAMGISTTVASCGSSSAAPRSPGSQAPPATPRPISPRPGDWPANVGTGKRVLVLGAGIAGMVTAIEMKKLGYDCTVLEARDVAGGRVRTLRSGDVARETDSVQTCMGICYEFFCCKFSVFDTDKI